MWMQEFVLEITFYVDAVYIQGAFKKTHRLTILHHQQSCVIS